jgi:hypothetical protein
MGEWIYRSTYSWPRHWLEVSGYLHARGKGPWYPLQRRLGGPQNRSRRGNEINSLPYQDLNSHPSAVQTIAGRTVLTLCLFIIYVTTFTISEIIYHWTARWIITVNDEPERCGTKRPWPDLRYYPGICLLPRGTKEAENILSRKPKKFPVRIAKKILSQDSQENPQSG